MPPAPEPDLNVEQVPPRQVRAARRRVQPGRLRTAASFRQPLGAAFGPGAVRGYPIDLRAKAESPRWPPDWWCRHEEQQYIAVAQWGLACWERHLAEGDPAWRAPAVATADYLLAQQHRAGARDGAWVHLWPYPHTYRLPAPWVSAMAQGEGASLLVRVHRATGEDRYAEAALRALRPLGVPSAAGGAEARLDGRSFPEELPTEPPSFILNGAIYALFGCHDVAVGLGDDRARERFEDGVDLLAASIGRWDTGSWSRYDLHPHRVANVANPFYHRLHIDQLTALDVLAPDPRLADAARRFARYERRRTAVVRVYGRKALFRVATPRSPRLAARWPWRVGATAR